MTTEILALIVASRRQEIERLEKAVGRDLQTVAEKMFMTIASEYPEFIGGNVNTPEGRLAVCRHFVAWTCWHTLETRGRKPI